MKRQWPLDTTIAFDPVIGDMNPENSQGYEILEDGSVHFKIKASDAKEVVIDVFGTVHPFTKIDDEMWEATINFGRGFKYFFLKIDGSDVLSPYFPIGYGCNRPINYVDIPVPGEDWGDLFDVPHGGVTRHYYKSSVTGKYEICMVYTPADYDQSKKYPVLYLQHGFGENETGWVFQGHVARMADKFLHDGEMEEMIIVMGNGMTQMEGPDRRFNLFIDVLLTDLIPFIENTYNVYTDKWHRAMAGLSMGSYQTSIVTLTHPELFGYAGVFSGFISIPHFGLPEPHLALLDDAEKFNESFKVFYRAIGTEDNHYQSFLNDDELLKDKPLNITREIFSGQHDWTVWRRCIHSFLPMIFKD